MYDQQFENIPMLAYFGDSSDESESEDESLSWRYIKR